LQACLVQVNPDLRHGEFTTSIESVEIRVYQRHAKNKRKVIPALDSITDGHRRIWLITGVAGFIGSTLLEGLLKRGQSVVGLDNFSTGYRHNLAQVKEAVGPREWERFTLIDGDIRSLLTCREACAGVDVVLHQAALGSVPRSIEDPIATHESNVTGFLNMLVAARDAKVRRFVYAASSAAYGDHPGSPKVEEAVGRPLSPYGAGKYMNELYADTFARCYGLEVIGLRYFNVFGPRQDPEGAYAAVIPQWIAAMLRGETVYINGDGETARDFCYVENVLQANLLSGTVSSAEALNQVYNIAVGDQTSLNELFEALRTSLSRRDSRFAAARAVHRDFRAGDVRFSLADISKARRLLGYNPSHRLHEGLEQAIGWYMANLSADRSNRKASA